MSKQALSGALSLSCVENYFLVWAAERTDVRALYGDSFVPATEVLSDFCQRGAKYERYDRIPRLQDVSERLGLTAHTRTAALPSGAGYGELVLIRVNELFFCGGRTPWRDDHYVWITGRKGGKYEYCNNYPLSQGTLGADELERVYGGAALRFVRAGRIDAAAEREARVRQLRAIGNQSCFTYDTAGADITALRNAVGILKITRRRVADWLAYLADACNLPTAAAYGDGWRALAGRLDALYLQLEWQALRGRGQAPAEKLNRILDEERELWKETKSCNAFAL